MEITIGTYGRMIFQLALNENKKLPKHWESVIDEARPLVLQLLALNDKISVDGGKSKLYEIIGLPEKDGKPKLSTQEKIKLAQEKNLLTTASTLVIGDLFWLCDHDYEMSIGGNDPVEVSDVSANGIYFEMPYCGDEHTVRISPNQKIYKAPDWFGDYRKACDRMHKGEISLDDFADIQKEFYARRKEFTSKDYWLRLAKELDL